MEEEIRAEFESSGFSVDDDGHVLSQLLTYCINYKLTPSDLVSHWEIYCLNRNLSGLKFESSHVDGFLAHIQNESKERLIKEETTLHIYSSGDIDMLLKREHDGQHDGQLMDIDHTYQTPKTEEKSSSRKQLNSDLTRITPFGQRISKFTQQFVFNADKMVSEPSESGEENGEDYIIRRTKTSQRCTFEVLSSQPKPSCRFMYDTIEDRFCSLESRISRSANLFAVCGAGNRELGDPTTASDKDVFAVGMIVCDGEGHLNEKSILLQGSVEHSSGQRVRLDIQNLTQYSLFPGQVVAVEGHNPSGHCFIAVNLVDTLPLNVEASLPPAKRQALDKEAGVTLPGPRTLSSIIAAGPFTTTDNLLFEPLEELLAYACRRPPQLLILMGPFIDLEHPDIKRGTVDQSFKDLLQTEVLRRIQDYTQILGSSARVILIPSLRDAHHDFLFPQPAFEFNLLDGSANQIASVANPSVFRSNEITVACCTVDILKHLSGLEISRSAPDEARASDRIARLAKHLLKQQSYYPLYPPALDVPFDFSLALEALDISSLPDVLLLTSDLAPFVKVLSLGEAENVLCINPGRLAKGIGGGTFVELYYEEDVEKTTATITRI